MSSASTDSPELIASAGVKPADESVRRGQDACEEAERFLQLATESAANLDDPQYQVFRMVQIAEIQFRLGKQESAKQTLQMAIASAARVEDVSYRAHRINDIAECYAKIGETEAALELIESVDEIHQDSAIRYICGALANAGSLKDAEELAMRIRRDSYRGEALQRIAIAHADLEDFESAKRIAAGIEAIPKRASAWVDIASRQFRAGKRMVSEDSLLRAMEAVSQIPPEQANRKSVVLAQIAEMQAELGDIDGMRQSVQGIDHDPWKDIAWVRIVTVFAKRGDDQGVRDALSSIGDDYYRGQAMKEIVLAGLGQHEITESQQLAESIELDFWRLSTQIEIAGFVSRTGDTAAASLVFEHVYQRIGRVVDDPMLPVSGMGPGLFYQLSKTRAQAESLDDASDWIEPLRSVDARVMVYIGLAEGLMLSQSDDPRP